MKKTLILFSLLVSFVYFDANGQKVVEQLIGTQQTFSPLFSNDAGQLTLIFAMEYDREQKDTSLYVFFDIGQTKVSTQGGAVSVGIFGRSLAGSGSSYYSIERKSGTLILDYNKFDTIHRFFNDVAEYTKRNYGRNRILMYSLDNFKLSLEITYRGGSDPKLAYDRFIYLSIDNSTYRLKETQFLDLTYETINNIKKAWDLYISDKMLPAMKY